MLRAAARAAEGSGDFAGALRLLRGLPRRPLDSQWEAQLREITARRPTPAALACWLVHPALRWALARPCGDVLLEYAGFVLKTQGVGATDRAELAVTFATSEPIVMDAGLFDGGLFQQYLHHAISPDLLARAGPLQDWSLQPTSVWQLLGGDSSSLLLRDLWSRSEIRCHPRPGGPSLRTGALLYGRLVPALGGVPFAFAVHPVEVDQRCAARLMRARQRASGPIERLRAVMRSRVREEQAELAA